MKVDDKSWTLRQMHLGKKAAWITSQRSVSHDELVDLAEANGLHLRADGTFSSAPRSLDHAAGTSEDSYVKPVEIPQRFTSQTVLPGRPSELPPSPPLIRPPVCGGDIDALMASTAEYTDLTIVRYRKKIAETAVALRGRVGYLDRAVIEKRRKTEERGRLEARRAELEAEIADIAKRLHPGRTADGRNALIAERARVSSERYYTRLAKLGTYPEIREWALSVGIDCPARAPRISKSILDAFEKAHPEKVANAVAIAPERATL